MRCDAGGETEECRASIVQKINTYRLKMPYVYGKGLCTQQRRSDADRQSRTGTVQKVHFMHAVTSAIPCASMRAASRS